MGFWESKACRVISGVAVLLVAVLGLTAAVYGYTVSRWTPATWAAVLVVAGCLMVCCCLRGRREAS